MILTGTGHRPQKLGGFSVETDMRLCRLARRVLQELRPKELVVGMALGWDQALAMMAIHAGVPFVAAIPCDGQEQFWAPELRHRYACLLEHAAEVVTVSPGPYADWKMHARNRWMVDRADRVAALWNGGPGGTRSCVGYAELKGKPVTNYWTALFDA